MAETDKAAQQQSQPATQQQTTKAPAKDKQIIAEKVTGTVKWFNVKCGYGFINRNDTKEDVFVHQTAIVKNNPRKAVRSVGDGEAVEFSVVAGEKGYEAACVTGPGGEAVKGSPYAADKRRGFPRPFYQRQGGGRGRDGAPRRGGRRGPPQGNQQGGQEGPQEGGQPVVRRYFRRNFRGRRGGGGGAGPQGGYRRPRGGRQSRGAATQNGQSSTPASSSDSQAAAASPKDTATIKESTTNESQA